MVSMAQFKPEAPHTMVVARAEGFGTADAKDLFSSLLKQSTRKSPRRLADVARNRREQSPLLWYPIGPDPWLPKILRANQGLHSMRDRWVDMHRVQFRCEHAGGTLALLLVEGSSTKHA